MLAQNRNTSITLGNRFEAFADLQVKSGRYNSVSEVIREGLRLLEERDLRLAALRSALSAGEKSGRSKNGYKSVFARLIKA